MTVARKRFISESEHILNSYRLGEMIFASGYQPTFIIGIWRGGSSVALAVQECLAYLGVKTDHSTVRTSYAGRLAYEKSVAANEGIRIHGKRYAFDTLNSGDRLLIVDDVYRSGRHTKALVERLQGGLRRNMPEAVKVAALWKYSDGDSGLGPDFFVEETDSWIVLPYELSGLSNDEIEKDKSFLGGFAP